MWNHVSEFLIVTGKKEGGNSALLFNFVELKYMKNGGY